MQFDIDQQDLINLARDTRKGFDRARYGLIFSLSVLAAIAASSAHQTYRAISVMFAAAPEVSVAGFADVYRQTPGVIYAGIAWVMLIIMCALLAIAIIKARRAREAARKKEILENSFSAGRFDYSLALDQIIVRGPLAARKVSWSNIERIEKKKSGMLLRRKDGELEFIPRNVWPKKDFFEQVMEKHGAAINKQFSFEEATHARLLSITYEAVRSDADEYFNHYFRRRDGRLNILRRLGQWRAWAPILFTVFTALFSFSAYAAFRNENLLLAAMSLAFAGAAIATFILNSAYFRGPAFPFRKDKSWPFAQTDLVTVTLSKNGVHRTRHGLSEFIQWAAFERYFETRLFGYLVISAKTIIPLPKRAFLSKSHYEKFAAFARRAIADAKHAHREEKRGRLMRTIGKEKRAEKPVEATKAAAAAAQANTPTKPQSQKAKPQQATKQKTVQKPQVSVKAPGLAAPPSKKPVTQDKAIPKQAAKPAPSGKAPSKSPTAPKERQKPADAQQAVQQTAQKKHAAQ